MRARILHFILIAAVAFITQPLAVVAAMGSSMPCCVAPDAGAAAPMTPASCPSCDGQAEPQKAPQPHDAGGAKSAAQSCCAFIIPVLFLSERPAPAGVIFAGAGDATPFLATCPVRDIQPLLPPPKVA